MPIEDISKQILKDAEKRAAEIKKDEEQVSGSILEAAKTKASEIKKTAKQNAEAKAKQILEQRRAGTGLDISRMDLIERQKAVDSSMKATKKRVAEEISEKHYKSVIKAALADFNLAVPEYETIVKAEKEGEEFGKYKTERTEKKGEALIMSNDKKIRLDASVEKLVDMNENTIMNILSKRMFKHSKKATK